MGVLNHQEKKGERKNGRVINLLKKLRQALKMARLPIIRFHDFRQTAAALMLNNGVDILVASRRLGHAKPSITLDVYGHLLAESDKNVARKIEELVIQ